MAIEYSLITQNGTSGTYWASLPTANPGDGSNYKERYGNAINGYKVFSGMSAWYVYYNVNKKISKSLICEIQGKWDDTSTRHGIISGFYSIIFTCFVNGVLNESFHGGVRGGGWRRIVTEQYYDAFQISAAQNRVSFIGLEIINNSSSGSSAIWLASGALHIVKNCILSGYRGLRLDTAATTISNCLIVGCVNTGIWSSSSSIFGTVIHNTLVTGCGIGIWLYIGQYAASPATIVNCAAISNTTNWYIDVTYGSPDTGSAFIGLNNAGPTGSFPYDTEGSAVTIDPTDFVNLAGGDYKHSLTSKLVGAGINFIGIEQDDISFSPRPNYNPDGEQAFDIGPYEFDYGNGLKPTQVSIKLSGIIEGSVFSIYSTIDNSVIVSPTTAGSSGMFSTTLDYVADIPIIIKVRKGTSGNRFLPYEAPGLITEDGYSLIVNQVEDTIAELI